MQTEHHHQQAKTVMEDYTVAKKTKAQMIARVNLVMTLGKALWCGS